jgi:hypothetical protein
MSHTPGPWVMEHDHDEWNHEGNKGVTRILGPNGMTIIGNFQYYPVAPDELDDYRLIAAAPELLEACKAVLHHPDLIYTGCDHEPLDTCGLDNLIPLRDQIRAAIAKAEGK